MRAAGAVPAAVLVRRRQRAVLPPVQRAAQIFPPDTLPAAGARLHPAAAAVLRQLRDLLRPVPVHRGAPDPGLRAGRCELGREDRRRARPGGGQGGDHPRDHAVAVGRGVREGRRQARARAAVPRRSGNRQDDDLEGDRDELQLPVRDDPGSGFAGMFIGMDAITVQFLAHKARKLAEKWGGQCIVFIDEIDAVGMRRQALGAAARRRRDPADIAPRLRFFGPNGSITPTGDLVIETRAWRERMFAQRAETPPTGYPTFVERTTRTDPADLPRLRDGRRQGGHGAQPAADRDGRDRRAAGDAQVLHQPVQHVPRRDVHRPGKVGKVSLRLPPPPPRAGADLLHRRLQRPDRRCSTRR